MLFGISNIYAYSTNKGDGQSRGKDVDNAVATGNTDLNVAVNMDTGNDNQDGASGQSSSSSNANGNIVSSNAVAPVSASLAPLKGGKSHTEIINAKVEVVFRNVAHSEILGRFWDRIVLCPKDFGVKCGWYPYFGRSDGFVQVTPDPVFHKGSDTLADPWNKGKGSWPLQGKNPADPDINFELKNYQDYYASYPALAVQPLANNGGSYSGPGNSKELVPRATNSGAQGFPTHQSTFPGFAPPGSRKRAGESGVDENTRKLKKNKTTDEASLDNPLYGRSRKKSSFNANALDAQAKAYQAAMNFAANASVQQQSPVLGVQNQAMAYQVVPQLPAPPMVHFSQPPQPGSVQPQIQQVSGIANVGSGGYQPQQGAYQGQSW